jgi:hypothetical protein
MGRPVLQIIARLLAAALVAFALWRVGTAPPPVVPVGPSARSPIAGARESRAAAEGMAGHHHRSLHGGVVGMVGDKHLEALALSGGRILVYLSGLGRESLPHDGLTGTVTVYRGGDVSALPLRVVYTGTGQGMEAMAGPLEPGTVQLDFLLEGHDGERLSMEFYLPVGAAVRRIGGAARRCGDEVESREAGSDRPRCTLEFDGAVTGLFALRSASHFVVSTTEAHPSVWTLPDVQLISEFRALPQRLLDATPMPAVARRVIAVRPDGREAVVALPGTLVRYVLPGGVPFSLLPGTGREAGTAAWSFDTKRLIVAEPGGRVLLLINVVNGELVREVELAADITGLAFSQSGRTAAVARADGTVSLIDFLTGEHDRSLRAGTRPLRAVTFSGRHVVAAGDDGVLRVWDVDSGQMLAETTIGTGLTAVAVAPDGIRLAVGSSDGQIHVHAFPSLAAIARLRHHETTVTGMVWTSAGLVSADTEGTVVIWSPTHG